jgi:hypothetical protein
MEKIKQIVNHPLSKGLVLCFIGALLLIDKHLFYSGISFGIGIREFLLAFKSD